MSAKQIYSESSLKCLHTFVCLISVLCCILFLFSAVIGINGTFREPASGTCILHLLYDAIFRSLLCFAVLQLVRAFISSYLPIFQSFVKPQKNSCISDMIYFLSMLSTLVKAQLRYPASHCTRECILP